tara:strand:+ start:1809 stop:2399 length:591 start_codon:yes stop_codon:yes gene_type:complete
MAKEEQTPEHLRSNRSQISQWIGRAVLKSMGWKVAGSIPNEKRILIVAAPHTSNWDFVIGMGALLGLNAKIRWIGKHTLFKPGISWFFRWLGGIPVNRKNPASLIEDVSNMIKKDRGLMIGVAPEGTRKKINRWKTGFLRIAKTTQSKILFISIDAPSKTIKIANTLFTPTEDKENDLEFVKSYFRNFKGINPDQS